MFIKFFKGTETENCRKCIGVKMYETEMSRCFTPWTHTHRKKEVCSCLPQNVSSLKCRCEVSNPQLLRLQPCLEIRSLKR